MTSYTSVANREILTLLAVYPQVSPWLSQEDKSSLAQISELWRRVVEAGSLPELLKQPGRNCQSPLAPLFKEVFPYLEECFCPHLPENRRDFLTQALASTVKETLNSFKINVIQSIGCGGCLRELILTIFLHGLGITRLHLILLDPGSGFSLSNWEKKKVHCQKSPMPRFAIRSFGRFVRFFLPRLDLKISYHKSTTEEYVQNKPVICPDILLMLDIDFQRALETSYQSLKEAGALGENTLIAWTQWDYTRSEIKTFVKFKREVNRIKEVTNGDVLAPSPFLRAASSARRL